jgi:hypothetical protein
MESVEETRERGRPTFLTIDIVQKIVKKVAEGVPPVVAAAEMGVVKRNFYNWMKNGQRDQQLETDSVFRELLEGVEVARAQFLSALTVNTVGKTKGQYSGVKDNVLILERLDPEHWRKRESIDVSGRIERVDNEQLTTVEDERLRIARTLVLLQEMGQINLNGDGNGRKALNAGRVGDVREGEVVDADGVREITSGPEATADEVHPARPESEADSIS